MSHPIQPRDWVHVHVNRHKRYGRVDHIRDDGKAVIRVVTDSGDVTELARSTLLLERVDHVPEEIRTSLVDSDAP